MKYFFSLILFYFLLNLAYSQESVEKNNTFSLKKNIHTISYEPITGIGYSYAREIKPCKYCGVGIQGALFQGTNFKFGYSTITKEINTFSYYFSIYFNLLIII